MGVLQRLPISGQAFSIIHPNFAFNNIRYHIVTPEQVFAEYDVEARVNSTGRVYRQSYAGRLVAHNGQIKLLRESLDTVAAAQAMFPNGLLDIQPAE
jgi:hypothetical protein